MNTLLNTRTVLQFYLALAFLVGSLASAPAQDLLPFIEDCKDYSGEVKKIMTKQKIDFNDYESPVLFKTEEYNKDKQLVKTEYALNRRITKTIQYFYKDSLLIYEHHATPDNEDYLLVYQYFQKQLPTKILKTNKDRMIINYSELKYNPDYQPVYLTVYNLLGELLEKKSVEFYSKNQVVIRSSYPNIGYSKIQKFELLCKYNQPKKLKKKDFKDIITRPINVIHQDNMVRIVTAVMVENKEKVHIEEISYDDFGNWLLKRTYELKKNKNKRKLIREIEREIEYY